MAQEKDVFLRIIKGRADKYGESEMILLDRDVTVIGRPPLEKNDVSPGRCIYVSDDYVSEDHLKIYFSPREKDYVVEERARAAPNHTYLNDKPLEPGRPYLLTDGDEIGVAKVSGEYRIVFRFRKSGEKGIDTLHDKNAARDLIVDIEARIVWLKGNKIDLRKKEFDLLAFLYERAGKACSREDIALNVWKGQKDEQDGVVSEETIDTTVHRLRAAIEPDIKSPKYIVNIHNFGFRLDL